MARGGMILFVALLGVASVFAEKFSFDGYELLSVFSRDESDADVLRELGETIPELDFWREPATEQNSTILVPPSSLDEFKAAVTEQGIPISILTDDVQGLVDAGNERTPDSIVRSRQRATGQVIDHYNYHTYSKVRDFLNKLALKHNNMKVTNLSYLTYESRPVVVVKLTGNSGTPKPAIIIEAGIHAREWISPAANLWFIEKVLQDYEIGDAKARSLLDKFDWYIVPVTNPDGYEYTHSTYRLWRKNRRYISSRCSGVDLNRNFDIAFGTTGVSTQCNSDIYPGPSAFSEAETSNIRELFNSLYDSVVAYVSVHAYSQFVLVPWGHTSYVSRPTNHVELDRVTKLMTSAISNKHGKVYRHGTAYQLLNYAASGASEDWAQSKKPGIISLCFELRPDAWDNRGFVLPANEIIATGQEYYASLAAMANAMKV